jgi:hypothetical protein
MCVLLFFREISPKSRVFKATIKSGINKDRCLVQTKIDGYSLVAGDLGEPPLEHGSHSKTDPAHEKRQETVQK